MVLQNENREIQRRNTHSLLILGNEKQSGVGTRTQSVRRNNNGRDLSKNPNLMEVAERNQKDIAADS